LAPNPHLHVEITPAVRSKGGRRKQQYEGSSPTERHAAMTWAQRLQHVFNIDVETCARCGGPVKVTRASKTKGSSTKYWIICETTNRKPPLHRCWYRHREFHRHALAGRKGEPRRHNDNYHSQGRR